MAEGSEEHTPAVEATSSAQSLSLDSPAPTPQPAVAELTLDEKYDIVRSVGEECITDEELRNLLANKPNPICYDGFEPSGRMHIAQGVVKAINVNKMTSAGCLVKIWIADWFAQLNNKMGGDLKKIQTTGRYLIEIWKAVGMNLDKVQFLWSSEEINRRPDEYWPLVMDIARRNSLSRIIRCGQIMGRTEQDELSAAQIMYPCMQCADIFFLKADICQLGMDQRKVNVLAREYCDDIKRKNKPIILSHHMLPGLLQGQEKMSKTDPSSSIYMEDEESQVNVKIKKAYCPPKIVEGNPCLEYIKYIIFPWFGKFEVVQDAKNGGNKTFSSMEELFADYESGELHPGDVKPALSKALNQILQPVRDHFKNNNEARELLKAVKMDSQNSSYYTNLLSSESANDEQFLTQSFNDGSQYYNEPVMPSQSPIEARSATKKSIRSKNFTTVEDVLLVSGWLNTGMNSITRNEQKKGSFWNRVHEYFVQNQKVNHNRTQVSLMNRWHTINQDVTKFVGFYAQIQGKQQSGVTEQDKVVETKEMFQSITGKQFQLEHCWVILKDHHKWQNTMPNSNSNKKSKIHSYGSPASSPSTPESINFREDSVMCQPFINNERPVSRKAAKQQLKNRKGNEAESNAVIILDNYRNDILEIEHGRKERYAIALEYQKELIEVEKERAQVEKEKALMKRMLEEERIMLINTSDMDPMQAEYYNYLKTDILRRRRQSDCN